jgi:hypothetical protein
MAGILPEMVFLLPKVCAVSVTEYVPILLSLSLKL